MFHLLIADDNNTTVKLFTMSYNGPVSNNSLVSEGQSAYVASGVISISAIVNGKKESVPAQYTQQLVEVSSIT